MKTIFPGDNPIVLLPQRTPPLNPILDTPGVFFDDKMAVVNASLRGLERGTALPLLLDLDSKPVFLHDNSVPSLGALFDSSRGAASVLSVRHRSTHRRRHVPAQSRHQLTGERALLFLKGGSRLRDALSAAWFGERQDARDVYLN